MKPRIETKSCKLLAHDYNALNRQLFYGRLPHSRNVFFGWSEVMYEAEDTLGLSCFIAPRRFKTNSLVEANMMVKTMNRLRPKKYDYYPIHQDAKSFIPLPYIVLCSQLYNQGKNRHKTLIHEMIHFDLFVRGLPYAGHGKVFDDERKRLFKYRKVRNLF
jgi:hypothetical protein